MDEKQPVLISRSGRVRKKSAKLLEVEDAAKPNVATSTEDMEIVVEDDVKEDEKSAPAPLFIVTDAVQEEPISPDNSTVQPPATKFGRVRKKTAKLLESEEIEELEKKQVCVKKVGALAGKKGKVKEENNSAPVTPQQLLYNTISQGAPESGTVRGAKTVRQLLASQSEARNTKGKRPQANSAESEEGSLKIKFHLGANPYVKTPSSADWKDKRPKYKTVKTEPQDEYGDVMPNLPLAEADMESDLTFKLILPASEIKVESDKLGLPVVGADVETEKDDKSSSRKKTKKSVRDAGRSNILAKTLLSSSDSEHIPLEQPELVILDNDAPPSKKRKQSLIIKPGEPGSLVKVPMVKTSAEKNVGRRKKEKLRKDGKPKKRRIATAYTMFCSAKRAEILAEHPGCDFAEISRRLAEKWQSTPGKEKILWKRKARRLATRTQKALEKGLTLSTKSVQRPPQTIKLKSGMSRAVVAQLAPGLQHNSVALVREAAVKVAQTKHEDRNISTSVNPVDAAAHLKLLGESLGIIGFRLQQHQGPIAIQGTMSVLLDSLLCALGPLTALCNYIPTMEGYAADVHAQTLDNIAYFMPGIG